MAKEIKLSKEVQAEIDAEEARFTAAFKADLLEKKGKLIEIATLRAERTEVQKDWNEADARLNELNKAIAKLDGKAPSGKKGTRTRKTGEALEQEKAALKAAGASIFKTLKKAGVKKQVPVGDLKEAGLGYAVKKALQPWIDAGYVKFHKNGPKPLYEFIEDGELPEEK